MENGTPAGQHYWFNPCNRLDSADRSATTFEFRNIWFLDGSRDKNLVFNRRQIGTRHAWVDKFIAVNHSPFITDVFADALLSAGITGLSLQEHYEEAD